MRSLSLTAAFPRRKSLLLAMLGIAFVPVALQAKPQLSTLYAFQGGTDGANPYTETLVPGPHGSLYGSTRVGTTGSAAVFQLSPAANGSTPWTYTLLQSFTGDQNGGRPTALLAGPNGSLFGETINGGDLTCVSVGCGLVFQLTPPANGQTMWSETILHTFSGTDGAFPRDGLVPDGQGNLFGTTLSSGAADSCEGCGTVFELSPPAMGQTAWSLATLFTFKKADYPAGKLLPDQSGGFYGITWGGGKDGHLCNSEYVGCGTIYHIVPPGHAHSVWKKTTIHEFTGRADGQTPYTELTLDADGNVLGMVQFGGLRPHCRAYPGGCGTVFKLAPPAGGQGDWTFSLPWQFTGKHDGEKPFAAGLMPFRGKYLTTTAGDGVFNFGTIDLFTPGDAGQPWTERSLFKFSNDANGADPESYLLERDGVFYGMSHGANGPFPYGTVFSFKP